MQILRTTVLVIIGELFFRANGLQQGFSMFKRIFTSFTFSGFNGDTLSQLGVDWQDMLIVGITIIIVFIVSFINEKGISIR